jgi:hypothetical protein
VQATIVNLELRLRAAGRLGLELAVAKYIERIEHPMRGLPDAIEPNGRWFVTKDTQRWPELAAAVEANGMLKTLEDPVFKRPWLGRQGVFGHGSKTLHEQAKEAAIGRALTRAESFSPRHSHAQPSCSAIRSTKTKRSHESCPRSTST